MEVVALKAEVDELKAEVERLKAEVVELKAEVPKPVGSGDTSHSPCPRQYHIVRASNSSKDQNRR